MSISLKPLRQAVHSVVLCLALLLPLVCPAVETKDKEGCKDTASVKAPPGQPAGWWAALVKTIDSKNCGSIVAVLNQLSQSKVKGGRQLNKDAALDVQAAERELAAARADPAFAADLRDELQGEANESRRLLVEAALLHEYGHYRARDLLLQRITLSSGG